MATRHQARLLKAVRKGTDRTGTTTSWPFERFAFCTAAPPSLEERQEAGRRNERLSLVASFDRGVRLTLNDHRVQIDGKRYRPLNIAEGRRVVVQLAEAPQ